MNFVGLAGQTGLICNALRGRRGATVRSLHSRNIQRRVPKSLPPILIQYLRSNLDAETFQREDLLICHPP